MKYKEINELIKSKFKEGDNLKAEYKNGRIIISMKQEKNIWTNAQSEDLDRRFRESEDRIVDRLSSKAPEWFIEWNKQEFKPLKSDVENIKQRLERIENTPTMKKELSDQK